MRTTEIERLLKRLESQLDGLIGFLRLSHEEVPHAGFLLGYSYAEAFVAALIQELYRGSGEQLDAGANWRDMNSLGGKIRHLEHRFGFTVKQPDDLLDAHRARHAWIHNGGVVNRPRPGARWADGMQVCLTVEYVNDLGVAARMYAQQLCEQAKRLFQQ
jgi:hypothetical protein